MYMYNRHMYVVEIFPFSPSLALAARKAGGVRRGDGSPATDAVLLLYYYIIILLYYYYYIFIMLYSPTREGVGEAAARQPPMQCITLRMA